MYGKCYGNFFIAKWGNVVLWCSVVHHMCSISNKRHNRDHCKQGLVHLVPFSTWFLLPFLLLLFSGKRVHRPGIVN